MVDIPALNVNLFDELPSTSSYLLYLADEKEITSGYAVTARKQTKGRGRYNRDWQSRDGNMAFSIYLNPDIPTENIGQLSFVVSNAMFETLNILGVGMDIIRLKWPNDVLINEKKVCGILIEKAKKGYVVGVGLNVTYAPEAFIALKDVLDEMPPLDEIIDIFCDTLCRHYIKWQEKGFDHVKQTWIEHAWGIGKQINVSLRHEQFKGVFKTLDSNGALIVQPLNEENTVKITSAEIFF